MKKGTPRVSPEFLDRARVHEIRNHLTALFVSAQLFPKKKGNPAFLDSFEKLLARETERLLDLVECLVADRSLVTEPLVLVDWKRLVEEAMELLGPVSQGRRIHLEVETGGSVHILGRECQLESLVLNLVRNALESAGPRGRVRISSREDGATLDFQVWNDGRSIPKGLRSEIFKPYFTTKKDGMGLGLAICRWVVQEHGGKIEVGSSARGTLFRVRLPLGMGAKSGKKGRPKG